MTAIILAILTLLSAGGDPIATWVAPAPPTEPAVQVVTQAPAPVEECYGVTVLLDWSDPLSPLQVGRVDHGVTNPSEVRVDVVGTFLWVQFDRLDSKVDAPVQTIPLTVDVASVQVCR